MDPKTAVLNEIFRKLDSNYDEVVSWRRHLHMFPELSFKEKNTAKFITEKLKSFGLRVISNIGGYGVVGILEGKLPGKTVLLRADFDALPVQDEKDTGYKSQIPAVMHACGHDGHTAALLGTAKVLCSYRNYMHGNAIFLFQPGEEIPPGGAKPMIEEGVLDNVDYVFSYHLDSQTQLGKFLVGSGFQMAAVDKFVIKVQGKGGHGGSPHKTIDSIIVASEIVNALQKIVSRSIDPLKAAVITIGIFRAGSSFNVIADHATLEGTVRTFDNDVRDMIKKKIFQIAEGIATCYGASFSIDYETGYPALYNHPEETETVRKLFTEEFSEENVLEMVPTMAAEDFSYFLLERPGTYFRVGSQTEDPATQYPHHHPKFDFDERALLYMEKAFCKIIHHYLFKKQDI